MRDTLKGCSWDRDSGLLRGVATLRCSEHGRWYSPAVASRFETKQRCSVVPCNTIFTSLGTSKAGFITAGADKCSLTYIKSPSQLMRGSKWVMPRETWSSPSSEGPVTEKDKGCASRQLENTSLICVRVCASNASPHLHSAWAGAQRWACCLLQQLAHH